MNCVIDMEKQNGSACGIGREKQKGLICGIAREKQKVVGLRVCQGEAEATAQAPAGGARGDYQQHAALGPAPPADGGYLAEGVPPAPNLGAPGQYLGDTHGIARYGPVFHISHTPKSRAYAQATCTRLLEASA